MSRTVGGGGGEAVLNGVDGGFEGGGARLGGMARDNVDLGYICVRHVCIEVHMKCLCH